MDTSGKLGLTQADWDTWWLYTEPNSKAHLLERIPPSPKAPPTLNLCTLLFIVSAVYLSYVSNRLYLYPV